MNYLRKVIDLQIRWSNQIDKLLPDSFRVDGNQTFVREFVKPYLLPGSVIYDVGGGKQPMIPVSSKNRLGMRIVGIDIDANELQSAPPGAYDQTICCDITKYTGNADGDVVICQALLEHVANVAEALRAIDSILKPGGVALIFVPSSNAAYAKLNLLLPEKLKRAILFSVFPHSAKVQGFRAYYDRCTPREIKRIASQFGLWTERAQLYYLSTYFAFFAPLYAVWRLWVLAFYFFDKEQSAETFSMAFRKPAVNQVGN